MSVVADDAEIVGVASQNGRGLKFSRALAHLSRIHLKAVGACKAGKAMALPLFPLFRKI